MSNAQFENVQIESLKPHPQNYREHPDDQLSHVIESIKKNGIYRNVVVSSDNFILAGHGVVKACKVLEITEVPIFRVPFEHASPQALKILTGDNEIQHLGVVDDRTLTEILKSIKDLDPEGLVGTGFSDEMLANLIMVTRPASEVADLNEAKEYVGMPSYDEGGSEIKLIIIFDSEDDRQKIIEQCGATNLNKVARTISFRYPPRERNDRKAEVFTVAQSE